MVNSGIASTLGFNTSDLAGEGLSRRWLIHRDSSLGKFMVIFMEKRISELQMTLEVCLPGEVQKVQGQLSEARKLKGFLSQPDISDEVKTVAVFLGVK